MARIAFKKDIKSEEIDEEDLGKIINPLFNRVMDGIKDGQVETVDVNES